MVKKSLNEIRINNSEYLLKNLRGIDWIRILPKRSYVKNVYFWCPIHILEDEIGMSTLEIRKYLYEKGIETRHRYNFPLYKQKVLHEKNFNSTRCPDSFYDKYLDYSKVY